MKLLMVIRLLARRMGGLLRKYFSQVERRGWQEILLLEALKIGLSLNLKCFREQVRERRLGCFFMDVTKPNLRFLCFGVGAIGTYIGGSLFLSGQKVVFLERPEISEIIRKQGLCIEKDGMEHNIKDIEIVSSIDDALTSGPYDAAIIAVKSYDTQAVMDSVKSYNVALPPFISFQNGVENEGVIERALGREKVISGTLTSAVGKKATGSVKLEKLRGTGLASNHILTGTLVDVFDKAGLRAKRYKSAASMKWSKLLTNLMSNATSAILNMTAEEVYQHKGLFELEIRQLKEALSVMSALKIHVSNLPGTPVKAVSFAAKHLPFFISQPLMIEGIAKGRGEKMPSFHIDLYGGRPKSEVDYLNGAVVRFGETLSIKTPVNRVLNQTLLDLTASKISKEEFDHQPEKLLELVHKA